MSFKIIVTDRFFKLLKKLAKRYPSLKDDVTSLGESLTVDPTQGVSLGNNCYKIRLAISSKGKGKSGGARVITYVLVTEETIYLLSIYDKSEQDSISDKELQALIDNI